MQLADAIILLTRLIQSGDTHQDYKRTVELSDLYKKLITGVDVGSLLVQFVQRESAEAFAQRIRLTKSITPAVASSIRKPFSKVLRNDRIRKVVTLENEARKATVNTMIRDFYGKRKKNRGLDHWMRKRFLQLQFTDPNAWVIVEWSKPEKLSETANPRPFEVSAEEAKNRLIVNEEVKWLHVCQNIKFIQLENGAATAQKKVDGFRHTLYDEDLTIVFEQVDPKYLESAGYVLRPGEFYREINMQNYLVRTFTPNVGFVPAFQIGYVPDEVTKGRTFVNPWHEALCFFEKTLKTVSELDLTMALHVFPQKLQYVHKCQGEVSEAGGRPQPCNAGYNKQGGVCGSCKGSGYKLHTTASDAVLLPMPDTKDDMLNLDQMLVYKSPPIETVKFQNEYTLQLERQAHQAVFNSQVFVQKSPGGANEGGGDIAKTATEADYNMESVYDALHPFTEKYSELWTDLVTLFAVIAGENLDRVDVTHLFPSDPKLKTVSVLMSERKRASESGAPSFIIQTVDNDLAEIIYNGDALGLTKYRVKCHFAPFPGKTQDEIALLLASPLVSKRAKVLYVNFDFIFKEIEKTNPEIWTLEDFEKREKLVEEKLTEFIKRLDQEAPRFDAVNFRGANPAAGESDAGGNPGEDDDDDEPE